MAAWWMKVTADTRQCKSCPNQTLATTVCSFHGIAVINKSSSFLKLQEHDLEETRVKLSSSAKTGIIRVWP